MTDDTKNVECANCGEYSKEKFCSMTCALSRPDILEADAMIRAGKNDSPCKHKGVVGKSHGQGKKCTNG